MKVFVSLPVGARIPSSPGLMMTFGFVSSVGGPKNGKSVSRMAHLFLCCENTNEHRFYSTLDKICQGIMNKKKPHWAFV